MQQKKLMYSALMALSLSFVSLAPSRAEAVTTLPSSATTIARPWLKMNPTTFQVSHASVLDQYVRVAEVDSRLTGAMRDRLARMLRAGEGEVVEVPDGIVYDYLTGRVNGGPGVYRTMRQALGRSHRALLFDLGDGVYVYWFTGEKGISCNNIGVVIVPPPVAYLPPPSPPKKSCRVVARTIAAPPPTFTFYQSFVLPGCCCLTYIPGLVTSSVPQSDSTSFETVCN